MTRGDHGPGVAPPPPHRVLVAGASPRSTELARALSTRGDEVVVGDDPGGDHPLRAAFALDVPDDFDTDGWAGELRRAHPGLPVAFAWSNPARAGRAGQCSRWLERTAAPDRWDWGSRHVHADLPADASAAANARDLVRSLDASREADVEDILVLAVSELATNAARHGRPPLHLDAVVHPAGIYLGVRDQGSGRLPRRRDARHFDEAGRGLAIVAAVADWWGVTARPDQVLVWCELGSPDIVDDVGLAADGPG